MGMELMGMEWFASFEEYTMYEKCPQCKAQPGYPCVRRDTKDAFFHVSRGDKGNRHYNKDVGNAPWREDRIDGMCYSTLPHRVFATGHDHGLG
jgi:hypothetical protein